MPRDVVNLRAMLKRRFLAGAGMLFFFFFFAAAPLFADDTGNIGLIFRGLAKTVGAAFQLPASLLQNSTKSFPLGLVAGALGGGLKTVMGTLSGAADMARGAAPYAKYMAFMI